MKKWIHEILSYAVMLGLYLFLPTFFSKMGLLRSVISPILPFCVIVVSYLFSYQMKLIYRFPIIIGGLFLLSLHLYPNLIVWYNSIIYMIVSLFSLAFGLKNKNYNIKEG